MTKYNPYGDFSVDVLPADTKPEDIFKDIPYTPAAHTLSATEKERLEHKVTLLRRSVEMLNNKELDTLSFYNERVLISCHDKLFVDGQLVSLDYALQRAIDSDQRHVQELWLKIADALEKRTTYTARVF